MKFTNKRVLYDGNWFDSKKELEYYLYLLTKYNKESIILQPKFMLQDKFEVHGEKIRAITYSADFQVGNIVIDVKNSGTFITPEFKLKFKIVKKLNPHLVFVMTYKEKGKWIVK